MGALCAHPKAWFINTARLGAFAALLSSVIALTGGALAATPANTPITNTATASYNIVGAPVTVTGTVTVLTAASTPATIEFIQYVSSTVGLPAGTASVQNVPVTQCNAGTGFTPLPASALPGAPTMTVPASLMLAPASLYAGGDLVFVRVTDFDQNIDPLVAETVVVTVSSNGIDSESLRLTETGPSTGIFIGYIPSKSSAANPGNCLLNVGGNQRLLATYVDVSAGGIAVTAAALVDPLGLVFDAATGLPVNGAQVTLINTATGLPAAVFGNDGVSNFPSTVTSGGTVTDSGGEVYAFTPGRYQFPRVAPGNYRLAITPPTSYAFPSTVAAPGLQVLPGGPFVIVTGSRGENFAVLPGPPLEIDVPLDPSAAAGVQITKSAGKAVVAIGEFVPYTITISNGGKTPAADLRIGDRLPVGFRYQAGSARLEKAVLADPKISADGRGLEFSVGTLPGNGTLSLRYVAAVLAGAQVGQAENTAQAIAGASSNVARASVLVREDLNRSRAILMGRVTQVDSCDNDAGSLPLGLKGVRVMLQDGTYIVTDQEGRWHADNIRPGTHVVQLDETSLPKGVELQACVQNSRTGGRNFSQFVNVRGGTLWRADFRFKRVASCLNQRLEQQGKSVSLRLSAPVANEAVSATVMLPNGAKVVEGSVKLDDTPFPQAEIGDGFLVVRLGEQSGNWQRQIHFELESVAGGNLALTTQLKPVGQPAQNLSPLHLKAPATEAAQCAPIALAAPTAVPVDPKSSVAAPVGRTAAATEQLVEQLPYDDKWIAAASPGVEWLHPQNDFVPALPVVKVAVKHEPRQQLELKVNGVAVGALRYDGVVMNPAGSLALSNWRAVDLREGSNLMEVTVRDPQGQIVLQETRTVHYGVGPSSAVFDAQRSQLVADGRSQPLIAVRMLDKEGQPVRRGAGGEFRVAAPYLSQDQADAIQREPLTGRLGGKARYQVGDDGVALIALQPTSQAGEVVLNFDFGGSRTQEIRTWLKPDLREWVLVGFAEGTVGFKGLSGNMESLSAAGAGEQLFDQNRVAFYAKGQVKGEYLLTMAYDSAKEKNAAGSTVLKQAVDPNQFYTLYGDATQPQFDAASARKLYLKIEKTQFYAMFGDYDTGLSVTELGRYSRTLNGFKSEYKGERVGYNAFASLTSQSFRKDEIQGDGTSGLYRLGGRDIVVNTDKVHIEVRDRFRPEIIISTRTYTRYLDYQIDHALGTLFFREPIFARDADFNPVFIVAEYESGSQTDAKLTYGGRAAVKVGEQSEVGLTRIHEGNLGREATLTAADTTLRFGDSTKLRAEIAQSQRNASVGKESGNAYLVELSRVDGQLDGRAYVRQQDAGFGLGQQAGAEAGTRKIGADARYRLSDAAQFQAEAYRQDNQVNDARRDVFEMRGKWTNEALTTGAGVRSASETDGTGKNAGVQQVIAGVGYEMLDKQLNLRASTELGIGGRGDSSTFPDRLILGIDYKLTAETTAFAEHEVARSTTLQANTTRVGLRTRPWNGAEALASLGNQISPDGGRLYGNLGLVQKWQIDDQWAADFGIDRSQTISGVATSPFNAAQPLASGTPSAGVSSVSSSASLMPNTGVGASPTLVNGDYTALFAGAAYRNKDWSSNVRLEWRGSATDTKVNLLLGAQRNLEDGRTMAAGLTYSRASGTTDNSKVDARLSYAHRPLNGELIWLNRLQYVHESTQDLAARLLTRKLVNNFNANLMPTSSTQIALQYGIKYVRDSIDNTAYKGFTDLVGIEARMDLGERWDIGLHGGMLHAWKTGARDYHLGISVGYKLTDNSWLSVGYNQLGFVDPDFAGAEYRARGLYLNLRVKFDQDSFNLNDRNRGRLSQLSVKP